MERLAAAEQGEVQMVGEGIGAGDDEGSFIGRRYLIKAIKQDEWIKTEQ